SAWPGSIVYLARRRSPRQSSLGGKRGKVRAAVLGAELREATRHRGFDPGLGDDEVHEHIVRLGHDGRYSRQLEGNSHGNRFRAQSSQRAIEVPAAITKS